MLEGKSLCVTCAWRAACNKKFLMDGATTTRCLEYTRDVTLQESTPPADSNENSPEKRKGDA